MAVCVECGMPPLGPMNQPFYTIEGQTTCATHTAERFARLAAIKINQLRNDVDAGSALITQLQLDLSALQARVSALELKVP